jgi:hypothetical protein
VRAAHKQRRLQLLLLPQQQQVAQLHAAERSSDLRDGFMAVQQPTTTINGKSPPPENML